MPVPVSRIYSLKVPILLFFSPHLLVTFPFAVRKYSNRSNLKETLYVVTGRTWGRSLAHLHPWIHIPLCSLCTRLPLLLISVKTAHSSAASGYFFSRDTFLVRFCKMKCVVFSSPVRSLISFIIHLFLGEYRLCL